MILSFLLQFSAFAGALCLLLFGMDMLSDGIQKGAGSSLQLLLGRLTGNRLSAVLTGICVTAIVQSSGATTVMVVSFVNAELINLVQAIAVIFGANIGTTVTAWIVSFFGFSFSISKIAIPLFGLGFILKYFKKFKIHNFSGCFMGFAILFMGLDLLKNSISLNTDTMAFLKSFSNMGIFGLLFGVFIGAFFTALIHSSSAMTAIVLTMAASGSLSWDLSAAIVLGSNIGSTIDAVMSSFGASLNAKRTAAVHVAFNVTGTLIAMVFFNPFLKLVDFIVPGLPQDNITIHIAMLHTCFNVCATLIFIPFVDQIAALAERFVVGKDLEDDLHYKLPAILPHSHLSVDLYAYQIRSEITKMAGKVMEMLDSVDASLRQSQPVEEEVIQRVNVLENYVDEMFESITHFMQTCSRAPNANHADRLNMARMIHVTQSLEDLSDELCSLMHSVEKYTNRKIFDPSSGKMKKLLSYMDQVHLFYEQVCIFIALGISDDERYMFAQMEDNIDKTKKDLSKASRKRIEAGNDVKAELDYMDIVRKLERAGDCVYSVVQALCNKNEVSLNPKENILTAKNVSVDLKSHRVYSYGNEVVLASKEYELLVMLLEHKGEVVTRRQLMSMIWNYEKGTESRTVDVHIRLLRQKLGNDDLIETVRGVGYRI